MPAERLQRRPQPARHLDRPRAVLPDLGDAERQQVLPSLAGDHHPKRSRVVAVLPVPPEPRRAADHREDVLEVVEHLDGGGRVVDRGRQRPDRDVDQDPQREGRVLLEGALDAQRHHALQPPLGALGVRHGPVDLEEDPAGRHEVAHGVLEDHDAPGARRPADHAPSGRRPGSRRDDGCGPPGPAARRRAPRPRRPRTAGLPPPPSPPSCARPGRRARRPSPGACGGAPGRRRPGRAPARRRAGSRRR